MKIKISRKHKFKSIQSSLDIFTILIEYYRSLDKYERFKEHFLVVALKVDLTINFIDVISIGNLKGTVVGIQEVFRRAIVEGGTDKIILAHNHPSQNKKPSEADIKLTEKLVEAGKILDIHIIDHLIITTKRSYYSMADKGHINT